MNTIIVSVDENWLIGKGNALPWHIPEEMKHFKEVTINQTVIMGNETYKSLGRKPLPKRNNIVLSRSLGCTGTLPVPPNASLAFVDDIDALEDISSEVFIIGGRQIYELFLKAGKVDKILLSRVKGTYEGDVYFPHELIADWKSKLVKQADQFDVFEYFPKEKANPV